MKVKRLFAALLSLCMVLSMITISASALESEYAIILGMNNISAGDMMYFGRYGGSPILWQVLNPTTTNAGGNGAFLISQYLLGNTNFGSPPLAWAGSAAQQWCTNFIGSTSNFSTVENSIIQSITKSDPPYSTYGASALNGEKAFFLSAQEASSYFADNNARIAYPLFGGAANYWWLRSPYDHDNAGAVDYSGTVSSAGAILPFSARPALNINLYSPSILFRSAATGGKSNGAEGTLNPVSSSTTGFPAWRLTLSDSTRSEFSVATTAISGTSVTISYSGAATGTNEYISAVVYEYYGGNITYYGRMKHVTGASDASGSITIAIPSGIIPGTNGTLMVFNEQYNGGASDNTNLTDYASPLQTVSNTVNAYALTVANGVDNTGHSPYSAGAQVSIAADVAPAGQQFKQWVSNNGGTFDNAASASTTFTMPAAAVTVTATYENIPQPGDAPEITQQPQNASVSEGSTAIFTVAATGTAPLTYQWQVDRNDGNGWQDVGENSASYTTAAARLSDSGHQYRCKVSNSAGEAISDTAVLTVALPPANNPPTAKATVPTQNVEAGATTGFDAGDIAEDADSGDTLTITAIATAPVSGTATASLGGNGVVTIAGVAAGNTSVIVTVSDGTDTVDVTVPIEVTAVPPGTYTLTITAGTGGSIAQGSNGDYTAGAVINIVASPDANYAFAGWTSSGGGVLGDAGSAATTFTMPAQSITITASFIYTGGSGGDAAPTYHTRLLRDSATGIQVSGSAIHRRAALTVKGITLHPVGACAACDAIRKAQAGGQLILGFDIDLTRGFFGPLTVSIPVSGRYNGRTVAILHCVNGRLETLTATVVNGKATFTVTSLSPFAVMTGLLVPDSVVADPPKTGDNHSNLVWWLLCGVSTAGIAALIPLCKRRRPYKR